jgi:hypothetical protein
MNKSRAISVQQISFNQIDATPKPIRAIPISFTEAEFRAACDQIAWKDPNFCQLHLECEQAESSRRFTKLRDSDPFLNETILAAEDKRDTLRPTLELALDNEDELDRETLPPPPQKETREMAYYRGLREEEAERHAA